MREVSTAYILAALILSSLFAIIPNTEASQGDTAQIPLCNADRNETWTVGLIYCNANMKSGYTLFSPISSTTTYLIDEHGREVHSWQSIGGHKPGLSAYLLNDGDLLRTANLGNNQPGDFTAGGAAGKIERISWDGELEWSWIYSTQTARSHHDIEPMPNGNVLVITWEEKSEEEVAQAGRDSASSGAGKALGSTTLWPDKVIEIQPIGSQDYNIVWEWSAWDHLVQDYDSTKDNFDIVGEHPEMIDINFNDANGGASGGRDWMHCNGIDYNQILDQIALSCKNMNEIYIIDHSTTTFEASGHSGGNSGMGGDILYRWGNPEAYRAGDENDQQLFGQHDVQWIEEDRPNSGDLIVFNNGVGRDELYSSVDIIKPPISNGSYIKLENLPFGPSSANWSWNIGTEMYASSISGAERLSNGNTLITYGTQGTFIEINSLGEIVWKYISPVNQNGEMNQGDSIYTGNGNKVFKVRKYDYNHNAFNGKFLTPGNYIESWIDNCPNEESIPWDRDGDGCLDDSDLDGVTDNLDLCNGFDDSNDLDTDGIPDGCDDLIDSDMDGVKDSEDECPGYDDNIDLDFDSIPDDCDDNIDSDNDMVSNENDQCPGFNDSIDVDNDTIPDGCDELIDSDFDNVSDIQDICNGFNDSIDLDNDTIPDGCDDLIDSDFDGIQDIYDKCEGSNDSIDLDNDLIPDGCDDNISSNENGSSGNNSTIDGNNSGNPNNNDLNSKSSNQIFKYAYHGIVILSVIAIISYLYRIRK